VQAVSAATILSETGTEMQQFGDEKHFSSWAGVCPGNNRSAGKNKSSHTTGGDPWLRSALTECAWAAANIKTCFLKEKFWRIVTKSGGKKWTDGQKERIIRHYIRRLGKLGVSAHSPLPAPSHPHRRVASTPMPESNNT
jgi:transposase